MRNATGQEHLLCTLRHLIVDMDGVLYRGSQAIPGVGGFVAFLRQRTIPFVLATNNSTMTPKQYVGKLAGMGVTVHTQEILTSSQATAGYLAGITSPGTRIFVVGQNGLRTALVDAGFVLVENDAEFVVVGMDPSACYEHLAQASLLIRGGAQFVGTNPDPTFPSERGIVPGAGSLLAFLETATGVAPTVIGKPGRAMMEQALARMGAGSSTAAVLGDRLETDILAGQRTGLHTILVLSGVTDRAVLARSEIQPDLVFRDVAHLHTTWQEVMDG